MNDFTQYRVVEMTVSFEKYAMMFLTLQMFIIPAFLWDL